MMHNEASLVFPFASSSALQLGLLLLVVVVVISTTTNGTFANAQLLPLDPQVMDAKCVLSSNLFSETFQIVLASPGFDGIIGIDPPLNKETVMATPGTWDTSL